MAETQTDNPGEPVTRGEGAEGFPHGSKYPLFVGGGFYFVGLGLSWSWLFLIVGVPTVLYGLWGWTREYAIEEYERGVVPEQKRQLLGSETGLLGMYLLAISELLVFAGFFVAYFYLNATRGPFSKLEGVPDLTLTLGFIMTLTLVAGSITIRWGRNAIEDGDRSTLVRGYAASFVFGLAFLAVLGYEWSTLMAEGLKWTTGAYGAAYYSLTGLHGAHVLAGLVLVGIVLYRAIARNHFSGNRNLMVRTVEAYYHFLTAISIAIFLFVYFR